ncbi:hypothetical protein H6F67_06990 [Microcoleus sp. FACHB-1515]|uniref:hypothetical protein n=1 Tax=Cyanophyceae TaxID=3028117 RepID=UPI001688B4B0|nr:hypothetical protein [Microcoleus sp. FACHB-1515]MBD2089596.1 hypothetical protein [Microcoleus sp. FACHB-1515]
MKLFFVCLPIGLIAAVASAFLYVNPPNCTIPYPDCPQFGKQQGGFPLPVLDDNVGESPTQSWGKIDEGDVASVNLSALGINSLFYAAIFWASGLIALRLLQKERS